MLLLIPSPVIIVMTMGLDQSLGSVCTFCSGPVPLYHLRSALLLADGAEQTEQRADLKERGRRRHLPCA
jgi:hypothetical protein